MWFWWAWLLHHVGLYTRSEVHYLVETARYDGAMEMVERYTPMVERLEDELERTANLKMAG